MKPLYIKEIAGKGRCVFCTEDIYPGELIEICPVIILLAKDRALIDKTGLYDYYFIWGDDQTQTAIALGYGSLYNHSYQANAQYESYYAEGEIHILGYRYIPANTEITINYNMEPDETNPVWFDVQ